MSDVPFYTSERKFNLEPITALEAEPSNQKTLRRLVRLENHVRERFRADIPAQISGAWSMLERDVHGPLEPVGNAVFPNVPEHQRGGEHGCGRVGNPFARNVGGAAVNALENRVFLTDVAGSRNAEPTDQSRRQIRDDVTEEVGRHDHVEAFGAHHQLHSAIVDDDVLGFHIRVFRGLLERRV
jgi:hypothetical protein